eukprot:763507-Hanusia_phi.AAC.1
MVDESCTELDCKVVDIWNLSVELVDLFTTTFNEMLLNRVRFLCLSAGVQLHGAGAGVCANAPPSTCLP